MNAENLLRVDLRCFHHVHTCPRTHAHTHTHTHTHGNYVRR